MSVLIEKCGLYHPRTLLRWFWSVFIQLSLYYSVLKNSKIWILINLSLLRGNWGVWLLRNIGRIIIRCNTLAVNIILGYWLPIYRLHLHASINNLVHIIIWKYMQHARIVLCIYTQTQCTRMSVWRI